MSSGIIVWIGGPVTAGGGAGNDTNRMSSLVSGALNLTEKNYATVTTTVASGLTDRCTAARDDTSYNHQSVDYVVLAGGLEDTLKNLAAVITKTREAITICKQAFPHARIVFAAGPGSLAGMNTARLADTKTIVSAILGQARTNGALAVDMRSVLGTDTGLQAIGILPNAEGHARSADELLAAIIEDRGEPLDAPVTTLTRRYGVSGDWLGRQVQSAQRREAEKREANRPTGTELGGVTQKLDDLTQQQGVQQALLELQQDELDKHQQELESQQQRLQAQQNQLSQQQTQLSQHQSRLEAQQQSLKAAQDAIKAAQDQLANQQTQLGNQQNQLNQQQQQLEASIRNYINTNLVPKLNEEFGKLDARVSKLEQGTIV